MYAYHYHTNKQVITIKMQYVRHFRTLIMTLLISTPLIPSGLAPVYANVVPAQAIKLYKEELAHHPKDDTLWNMIGWAYYQQQQYAKAVVAFQTQLRLSPNNPYAIWGLANCYGNSQVREFAKARNYLQLLLKSSERSSALTMLKNLPANGVDATYQPTRPITYEDAIAMALSYRSGIIGHTTTLIRARNGKAPDSDVAPYVSYAAAHGLLDNLNIPSFQAPATRLFTALFLAKEYGINQFDYIRPFPLTDTANIPVSAQMYVNSMLAMGIMTAANGHQFQPDAPMTRADFAKMISHANQVMKNPPTSSKWLTPPAPPSSPAQLYFLRTSEPDIATQENDFSQHIGQISGIAFTDFPLIADTTSTVASIREKIDTTQYIFTPLSAGSDVPTEISMAAADGMNPYMVLSNYSYQTDTSNPQIINQLLSDPTQSAGLANEVVQVAKSEHLAGITVDYENIWISDRAALTTFVNTLHQDLAGTGIKLMVCLPEQQSDTYQTAYDYKALGQAADLVMLITYDEHTLGSSPGPIANLSNVVRTVQYAAQVIPPHKILLGLADYGYDWSNGSGTQIDMATAYSLAQSHQATIQWDAATASSHFTYTDSSGQLHTVYFESGQSLAALAKIVPTYGLKGYAAWYLGGENSAFWNALSPYIAPVTVPN